MTPPTNPYGEPPLFVVGTTRPTSSPTLTGNPRRQRDASVFAGNPDEGVEDWFIFFEQISLHIRWNSDMKLTDVIFYFSDVAKT